MNKSGYPIHGGREHHRGLECGAESQLRCAIQGFAGLGKLEQRFRRADSEFDERVVPARFECNHALLSRGGGAIRITTAIWRLPRGRAAVCCRRHL